MRKEWNLMGGIFCLGLNSMKITSGKKAFILFFLMI